MAEINMWDQGQDDVWKEATQIHIKVYEVETQGRYARDDSKSIKVKTGPVEIFKFIAPNEISESIAHTWEPYENTSTKIAEGFKKFTEGITAGEASVDAVVDLLKGNKFISSGQIANTRIDTPLVYTNSERRKYDFTFNLTIWNDDSRILNGIQKLKKYSSPLKKDDIVQIKTPHVFEIKTYPAEFINISQDGGTGYAALTSIQTVFKGPYLTSGYCTNCELQLSFQELSPIFDTDFKDITSVKKITETK